MYLCETHSSGLAGWMNDGGTIVYVYRRDEWLQSFVHSHRTGLQTEPTQWPLVSVALVVRWLSDGVGTVKQFRFSVRTTLSPPSAFAHYFLELIKFDDDTRDRTVNEGVGGGLRWIAKVLNTWDDDNGSIGVRMNAPTHEWPDCFMAAAERVECVRF